MNRELLKQAHDALIGSVDDSRDVLTAHLADWGESWRPERIAAMRKTIADGDAAIAALEAELAKPEQPDYAPDTSVFVDGVLFAWFAVFDEAAQVWCTENHFGKWTTWQANAPVTIPITPDELKRIEADAADMAAKFKEAETRNCSRHPDAPHGPDGAGCKCHSWAPGEAS